MASLRQITPGFLTRSASRFVQGRDVTDAIPHRRRRSPSSARRSRNSTGPGRIRSGGFHHRLRRARPSSASSAISACAGSSEPTASRRFICRRGRFPTTTSCSTRRRISAIKASVPVASLVPSRRADHRARGSPAADCQHPSAGDIVAGETEPRQVQLRALGAFALIAFLLAALGIHGLLAFHVSTRSTRSACGWRLARAIGASCASSRPCDRVDRLRPRHRSGVSWNAGKWLSALLAGVSPSDIVDVRSAAMLALVMAATGSLLPVARALRVSPLIALRNE